MLYPVEAGEKIALFVNVKTPPKPGKYKLIVTMVEEGVTWFHEKINDSPSIPLEVTSP